MTELEKRRRAEALAHRMELTQWFKQRRDDYEASRLRERQTKGQSRKVQAVRKAVKEAAEAERLQKVKDQEAVVEEARLLQWQQVWDTKRAHRAKEKEAQVSVAYILYVRGWLYITHVSIHACVSATVC